MHIITHHSSNVLFDMEYLILEWQIIDMVQPRGLELPDCKMQWWIQDGTFASKLSPSYILNI